MRQLSIGQPGCFLVFDAVPLGSLGARGEITRMKKLDTAGIQQLAGTRATASKKTNNLLEMQIADIKDKQPVEKQTTSEQQRSGRQANSR